MRYGWLYLLLLAQWVSAQGVISGNIRDGKQQPIPFLNITLHEPKSSAILAFTQSDKDGKFRITCPAKTDSVQLKVYGLGFATKVVTVANRSQELTIELQEKTTELKEVVVKQPPMVRKGDTLSYSVDAFKTQSDRSIGDLIKRLPGIEVDAAGQIKYQGKAINKYYIEGLDLLEGRYSLANENLPVDAVTKVQVIEKHQPIRALDSLVLSDQAALNIQLRSNVATTGTAQVGVGGRPLLWDVNLTPMLFSKKQQFIASVQSNNLGNPIETQIRVLTLEDALNPFANPRPQQPWLRIIPVDTPPFSTTRWLYNRPHLGTVNYLKKLPGAYEVKLNVSYLQDRQRQTGHTATVNYTPTDTIRYTEHVRNHLSFHTLEASMVVERNAKSAYLKNQTTVLTQWNQASGESINNQTPIHQQVRNTYFSLTNQLKDIFKLRKQAISLQSFLRLEQLPQTLGISPGPLPALFNTHVPFDSLMQRVSIRSFFSNTVISLRKNVRGVLLSPQVGFQWENQRLESQIGKVLATDTEQWLTGDFMNQLQWRKSSFYSRLQAQYQFKNWKTTIHLPLTSYHFSMTDSLFKKSQRIQQLAFEPKAIIHFEPTAFWKFSTHAEKSYDFGELNDIYYGYLLRDYRSVQRRNVPLSQIKKWQGNVSVRYSNQIHGIFGLLGYSKSWSDFNLLYGTTLSANGVTESFARAVPNQGINQFLSGELSKYVQSLNSQIRLRFENTTFQRQQLINGILLPFQTTARSWSVKLDVKPLKTVHLYYTLNATNTRINMGEQQTVSASQYTHQLEASVYLNKRIYLGFTNEYYVNRSQTTVKPSLFSDVVFRYTILKKKMDLETNWTNIWNTKDLTMFSASTYAFTQSVYQLRPMQLMQTIRFSF